MEHNLDFGAEAQVNHFLAVLRAQALSKRVASGEKFSPGVYISIDPESDTKAHVTSRPGELLELSFTSRRPGQWLSLNIEMGNCSLINRNIAGFMCKARSEATITFRVCLRSGSPNGGFKDAFFGKRVISYIDQSTHADMMKIEERNDIPTEAPWREMVIFLPPDIRELSLKNLAIFGV